MKSKRATSGRLGVCEILNTLQPKDVSLLRMVRELLGLQVWTCVINTFLTLAQGIVRVSVEVLMKGILKERKDQIRRAWREEEHLSLLKWQL